MKKRILLRILLILAPVLLASAALLMFWALPDDDNVVIEGAVEIASHTCYVQAGGMIREVLVQTGQNVHQGETLAVIDDREVDDQIAQLKQTLIMKEAQLRQRMSPSGMDAYEAARQAAEDNVIMWKETLAQAERTLAVARQDLEIYKQLFDAGDISATELRSYEQVVVNARSQVEVTRAQLSAAQNNVNAIQNPSSGEEAVTAAQADVELTRLMISQLERKREDYMICAAADGVVISSLLEAGASVIPGQKAFQISNGMLQHFVFYLPQEYVDLIAFGDELILTRQGSREEAARGVVDYIDWQAVYPPDDYENRSNKNKKSIKIKARIISGGPFAVGQTLFLRLDTTRE